MPNATRTAVCCDLLGQICADFGHFESLTGTLVPLLFKAIYKNFDKSWKRPEVFVDGDARFEAVRALVERRRTLHAQLQDWETELAKVSQQMRNREFMLRHVGGHVSSVSKKQTFRAWKKVIEFKRKDQEKLSMALRHFASRNLKSLLRAWKLVVERSKRQRLDQGLEALKHQTANCEEVRKELEDELLSVEKSAAGERGKLDKKQGELTKVSLELDKVRKEIALSKERELQDIAVQWQRLNCQLLNFEISEMQKQLQAVDWQTFQDPHVLLQEGEQALRSQPSFLLEMPLDELLLRWLAFQLRRAQYPKLVQNFGSDLKNSEAYCALLHVITARASWVRDADADEQVQLENRLSSADPFARSEEIIERLVHGITPSSPRILQPLDICDGVADKNLAQICFLFCEFPCLHPSAGTEGSCAWADAQLAVDNVAMEWKVLNRKGSRGIGTELGPNGTTQHSHTQAERVEGKDRPHSHVGVKFEQLVSGYEQLERAKQLVGRRVEERWRTIQLWEALHRRVQQAAWDLLLQRGCGDPVQVPDRKQERELRIYTRVDDRLHSLLEAGGRDPALEKQKVVQLLIQHFEDVRRIFAHYSAVEDGGGNNTMDLKEFVAFVKDSKLVDKQTLPMKEVQRIFIETNQASSQRHEEVEDEGAARGYSTLTLNPEVELTAEEFVEALLRLAHSKYQHQTQLSGQIDNVNPVDANQGSPAPLSLSQRFTRLIRQAIRHACRSDAERWRRELADTNVKAVLHRHRRGLEALFSEYAGTESLLQSSNCL